MRCLLGLLAAGFTACTTTSTPPPRAQLVAEFSVKNLQRSRAFYESIGFRTTHTEKTFAELRWQDGHKLFLSQSRVDAPPNKPVVNLRVGVADVDAWWQRAKSVNARVINPIGDRFYGERDFLISDPDGYGLRFASLLRTGHW